MIPLRFASELAYQLEQAGEQARLARVLAAGPVFSVLWVSERTYALTAWNRLSTDGMEPEKMIAPPRLDVPDMQLGSRMNFLSHVAQLFEARGSYDHSIAFARLFLETARRHGEKKPIAQAHLALANGQFRREEYDDAMDHLEQAVAIAREEGYQTIEARATNAIGTIYYYRSDYPNALPAFEEYYTIGETLGDARMMAHAMNHIGMIHLSQGRETEAERIFERSFAISKSLGDLREMATNNLGVAQMGLGHYAEAQELFELQVAMAESLGDKSCVSNTLGNIGILHYWQGHYSEAIEVYERDRILGKSIGDTLGWAITTGNEGDVFLAQGKYVEAIDLLQTALEEHRMLGYKYGQTYWLRSLARAGLECAQLKLPCSIDLAQAKACAAECLALSQELQKPDTLGSTKALLARIDAAEGNPALAEKTLQALLIEATSEEEIASLNYWLWKIAGSMACQRDSIARYERLLQHTPHFEFRKRIAELKGERVPMSGEDLEGRE